jgi:hypothetical protein
MNAKQNDSKKHQVKFGLNWIKLKLYNWAFAGEFTLLERFVIFILVFLILFFVTEYAIIMF